MDQPSMRVGAVPEGYVSLTLFIAGTPYRPQVYVCNKCGSMVGNTTDHNRWHVDQEKLSGTITRTEIENLDEFFDDFDINHNRYEFPPPN